MEDLPETIEQNETERMTQNQTEIEEASVGLSDILPETLVQDEEDVEMSELPETIVQNEVGLNEEGSMEISLEEKYVQNPQQSQVPRI